ncbi:MAG: carboxypeptidase regulatory-like domain-containing protein, partial [Planctomycetes bacterium]|nr:carboxypeptidase regulatory-like domain-containing protein [Planctomycetota bacterium]
IVATTSRADGTFTLYGVDPGKVVVAATATARASCLKQDVACGSGQTVNVGDLYLTYGSTTRVEVVDGEGEPIAGARVFVAASSFGIPAHIAEPAGVTDERGVVEHEGLPVGLALAAAQRPNDAAWHVGESGSAEGTLRVVIPSRHSLTLAVVDTNGQPVARPRLRLVAGHQGHGVLELALFGAQQSVDLGRRLRRLDDGRLGITELDGGPWTVCVGAEGFATAVEEIELAGDVERTIELRPARELTVRTVDGTGEPVADATIYVRSRGGSRAERIVDLPVPSGRTGRDGVCRVRDLPTELTRITAMHPAFGQVHTEVEGRPAELVLRFVTPASIHGTLTDGGRVPEPGRWVVVLERRYDDPSERRGAMPEMPQLALPDLDGRFRFAALQPGSWRVTAQDSVADVGTVAGIHDYLARRKNIFPWNKADVALQGGVDVEVRLDAIVDAAPFEGPGATVQGHVSIDGVPAIGAIVVGTTKNPERRVTSRVNLAGSFDLGRVPAGELQVVVVSADVADSRLKENLFSHLYSRRFRIEPDRPLGLPIAIATGSVFGELRDDAGAPVAGARIGLHDRGNAERSSALRVMRTDSQGGFDFAGVPVGLYELRAEATGRSATRSGIAVAAGARVGPLDVRLVRLAELHGQVVPDRPIGPEGAVLVLHPLDRGAAARPQRATVGPDGSFSVRAIAVGEYRAELVRDGARTPFGTVRVTLPKTEGVLLRPSG